MGFQAQFYIQLVYKATLSFTIRIQIVSGKSLSFFLNKQKNVRKIKIKSAHENIENYPQKYSSN